MTYAKLNEDGTIEEAPVKYVTETETIYNFDQWPEKLEAHGYHEVVYPEVIPEGASPVYTLAPPVQTEEERTEMWTDEDGEHTETYTETVCDRTYPIIRVSY